MRNGFNNNDRHAKRPAGFTLVELLVVIAIIAVLMAILLPVLSMARNQAYRLACASNLKNLAKAWSLYLEENDGRFYQGLRANADYGGWEGLKKWRSDRVLNSYVGIDANNVTEKSAEVFLCPADRGGIPGVFWDEKAHRAFGTSYQTNIFLIGQDSCGTFSSRTAVLDTEIGKRLANMNRKNITVNETRLLLMGDYGWINQWHPEPHPYEELKEMAEWHNKPDHHNMAFLDEHVEFLNIHKGYYVRDEYSVLPFQDLLKLAHEVQGPAE